MTYSTRLDQVKNEKETNKYMENIAFTAIAYVASLASDDEELSVDLLKKLIISVIGNEQPKEVFNA